ncbi:MAG: signal peptidase complex subunit 3 family protein [archaeon]|nr:signal peptidase complex subunit 3 family protein [archaeon]
MYSLSVRANKITFCYFVCLAALGAFNILTSVFNDNKPKVNSFNFKTLHLYFNQYTGVQHATGSLTFDIDFRSCLNWNSNLAFSWISATYTTGKDIKTSVTIWDRIMLRDDIGSQMAIVEDLRTFYPLVDSKKKLAGKEVTLELHWEHMPVIGPIIKKKIPLGKYIIPSTPLPAPNRKIIANEYDYEDESDRKYYD